MACHKNTSGNLIQCPLALGGPLCSSNSAPGVREIENKSHGCRPQK